MSGIPICIAGSSASDNHDLMNEFARGQSPKPSPLAPSYAVLHCRRRPAAPAIRLAAEIQISANSRFFIFPVVRPDAWHVVCT
jgi:hypothetical protein